MENKYQMLMRKSASITKNIIFVHGQFYDISKLIKARNYVNHISFAQNGKEFFPVLHTTHHATMEIDSIGNTQCDCWCSVDRFRYSRGQKNHLMTIKFNEQYFKTANRPIFGFRTRHSVLHAVMRSHTQTDTLMPIDGQLNDIIDNMKFVRNHSWRSE